MKKFLAVLFVLLCCTHIAAAADTHKLDYGDFSLLPVLHEGRVKPMDSFARITLRDFSGEETIRGHSAVEWLAGVLFDPAAAAETRVFEITNPAVRERLELDESRVLFSLTDLAPALNNHSAETASLVAANPGQLTAEQAEILKLYKKVETYNELLRAFSAILPLQITAPENYAPGDAENTYLDFMASHEQIKKDAEKLVAAKGADFEAYNDKEKALASLAYIMEEIHNSGQANNTLRIINFNGQWISPWQFLLQQNGDLAPWQDIANAYRMGDAERWKTTVQAAKGKTPFRLKLEKAYNVTDPFHSAMGFYVLCIILLAAEIYRKSNRTLFPLICAGAGLALHTAGLLARMIILHRPPVATLYESLLFVSLVCVICALVFFYKRQNFAALFAGPGSAAFLLFIAPFLLQQGESMEMLVAVLNTSFWLGTHVLCITAGYGLSILTAVLAHAWYVLLWKKAPAEKLDLLYDSVYKFSLVALFFTGLGTILGGIWADQSWGRFWGWDPKENGALLIVLWLVWMQHGRIAGLLNAHAFMAAAAFLNVIVALAWFGVNLLSVGLHSYGFISGIALGLAFFCSGEAILIAMLWKLNVTKIHHALA